MGAAPGRRSGTCICEAWVPTAARAKGKVGPTSGLLANAFTQATARAVNQSLLFAGRALAISQLPEMMHIARELCGGQIYVTPDAASFRNADAGPWLDKFCSINDKWFADDRRKLLAFASDLLNSDYEGHRMAFQIFAQSPSFTHLAAVYRNFDWGGPLNVVNKAAQLLGRVVGVPAPVHGKPAPQPSNRNGPHTYPQVQHSGHLSRAKPRQ